MMFFVQEPGKEVVDCSLCGSSGFAISGDLNLLERLVLHADARYVIIVEKVSLLEVVWFIQIPNFAELLHHAILKVETFHTFPRKNNTFWYNNIWFSFSTQYFSGLLRIGFFIKFRAFLSLLKAIQTWPQGTLHTSLQDR